LKHQENRVLIKDLPKYSYLPGLPLVFLSTILLLLPSLLPLPLNLALSLTTSSLASLWQLQILHDQCHSLLLPPTLNNRATKLLMTALGSVSWYGYNTYLQLGHISHHNIGGSVSHRSSFEDAVDYLPDGDVLFGSHRAIIKGDKAKVGIGMNGWFREGKTGWNAMLYAASFSFERIFLGLNDVVTAVCRRNFFFPNSSPILRKSMVSISTVGVVVRLALVKLLGWKVLLSLYIAELSWCIPPNPLAGCFLNNHSTQPVPSTSSCVPTKSYRTSSPLYSLLTLNTNHHKEHHDFPNVPFHMLHIIKKMKGYDDDEDDEVGNGGISKIEEKEGLELWFEKGGTYGCQ